MCQRMILATFVIVFLLPVHFIGIADDASGSEPIEISFVVKGTVTHHGVKIGLDFFYPHKLSVFMPQSLL